jgi:peptidoglycan hydrolase CwlO-like protein
MTITELGLIVNATVSICLIVWTVVKERNKANADLEGIGKTDIDASASAASAIKQYSDEIIRLRDQHKAENDGFRADIEKLQNEVKTLQSNRAEDRATIDEWKAGIRRLLAQMESQNIIPVWKPSNLSAVPHTNE